MVVCHCRAVTDRAICAAIRAGASDVDSLAECCGAGSGCGGCWPALEHLLASHEASARAGGQMAHAGVPA